MNGLSPFWSQVALWTVVLAPVGFGWWLAGRQKRRNEAARVAAFFADLRAEVDAAEAEEARRIEDHWAEHGGLWPVQCAALLEGDMRCVGKAHEEGLCRIHAAIKNGASWGPEAITTVVDPWDERPWTGGAA